MSSSYSNGDNNSDICVPITSLTAQHRMYAPFDELQEFYCNEFGSKPKFFVRVGGRVNIIGEHVDYCGYPVLPMALDQCIILAVGYNANDTTLQLRNVESKKFQNYTCDLQSISIDPSLSAGPEWYKYYLCGVKGVHESLGDDFKPIGMTVALRGNIPPASGLSSSSALVSAAALATAHVHGMELDKKRLASLSASCERYIGTQGGGMDQAIAYLAKEGCAQFIEFHPELNATPIQLPSRAYFVVANSLVQANKAATSDFNERVVECGLAARIMAKRSDLSDWRNIKRFVDLQEAISVSLERLEELVQDFLPKDIYTRNDVCQELSVDDAELEKDFLTPNTRHMEKFKLRQRALHVVQESLRVQKFRVFCESANHSNGAANGNADPQDLTTLSLLMRQSHQSLQQLYECSHPDLDRLIEISDSLGVGARLTGAGWGGCIVALCDSPESCCKYMQQLKEKYFAFLPPHLVEEHRANDFADVIFSTRPCSGAEIFTVAP